MPTLIWSQDSNPVPSTAKVEIQENADGVIVGRLTLPKTAMKDAGMYSVRAENTEGSAESKAPLEVISKMGDGEPCEPSFSKPCAEDIYVDEGKPLVIECKVLGNPLPEIKFLKDGTPIDSQRGTINFDGQNV